MSYQAVSPPKAQSEGHTRAGNSESFGEGEEVKKLQVALQEVLNPKP